MKNTESEDLYQMTAPHLCAGIVVRGGIVIKAAPILRWTVGKALAEIEGYCTRKGWGIAAIGPRVEIL